MKKSLAFRVIGFSLVALAFLSFAADVAFRALHGGWNETYYSAKLVSWTYGGAFIVLCALGLVVLVGLFFGLRKRWNDRERI